MRKPIVLFAVPLLLLTGCELAGLLGPRSAPPPNRGPAGAPPPSDPAAQPASAPAAGPSGQLVDCRRAEYRSSERPGALVNRSQRPYRTAKNWSRAKLFPTAECTQAVTMRAQAYCQKPHVGYYKKELQRALTLCRAWDARRRAYQNARAGGGSGLLASMTPDQARRKVNSWLSWARSSRGGRKALGYYALVLHHQPANAKAQAGFDQTFASYYGVDAATAAKYRVARRYHGRLAAMPKAKLYTLAIRELLGELHKVSGTQPELGLSYLDALFLLEKVYLPSLKANPDKFRSILCARNLARARKDFRPEAVRAALGTGVCKQSRTELTPFVVLHDDRIRLALIRILAQHTATPTDTVARATLTIARQVGAKRTRVCWTQWNPMGIRKGVGNACSSRWARASFRSNVRRRTRSRFRGQALTDKFLPRHPYYAAIYQPKPMNKLTRFEAELALSMAKQAGATGAALAKQLAKRVRRAPKYKCVAFKVNIVRHRRGRGSWSKPALSGVGSSRDVSCRKVRRNGALKRAVPKRWTNFYDTVRGGKYTGSWRTRRTFRRRRYGRGWYWDVRRIRPAVIYVRRKI